MKKAKIMLLTIAVIATVGTALAFKVNKLGSTTYCYLETTSQPADGACINTITSAKALGGTPTKYFYAVKPAGTACPDATTLVCDKSAKDFTN